MKKTTTQGLSLAHGALAHPPLMIPDKDGNPYKIELVHSRDENGVIKFNFWLAADGNRGDKPMPHNHPWTFTATVLHGRLTETRYRVVGGKVETEEITHVAGEDYTLPAHEYHLVTSIEKGTVTKMCCLVASPVTPEGSVKQDANEWGYLDLDTCRYYKAEPDPTFFARLVKLNPWKAPGFGGDEND